MHFDLEPVVEEAVRRQSGLYPRPPESLAPAEVRAVAGVVPPADPALRPPGVAVHDETLALDAPSRIIQLRRYHVPRAKLRTVYFHGGGFTLGGLDSHDAACAALAVESGTQVIAVDYRKLPDHPFPAAYEDAVGVLRALGREAGPIALAGDSSGANLALAAALTLRGKVALHGLLLYYPVIGLDFETDSYRRNAQAPMLTRARCERIWADYLSGKIDAVRDAKDWRAAPLLAPDFSGLPPTVIAVAEYDPLLSDGILLAEQLRSAGAQPTLVEAARLPHGFLRMRAISAEAERAVTRATHAFRDALG